MKRVSPYLKMQVLGAIEFAPGACVVQRIRHVSELVFTDESSQQFRFTWRTIQTWYSRYKKNGDGKFSIKNELLDHCWKMWHSCVITWDGKVVPCCFDKDAHFVLGDLNQNTFKEIWTGEKYNEFRASLLRSRSEIEMCRNCTEGTKVWA